MDRLIATGAPPFSYVHPNVILSRDVRFGNAGLFTKCHIPKGTPVVLWTGRIISSSQVLEMPPDERHYTLQVDDDLMQAPFRQGVREPADFTNHSCEPNCGFGGSAKLVAMRDLAPGEELTFDYAMSDSTFPKEFEFECACGSKVCRGAFTEDDWKLPSLQVRYAGYFSSYLARKIVSHYNQLTNDTWNKVNHLILEALANELSKTKNLSPSSPNNEVEVIPSSPPSPPASPPSDDFLSMSSPVPSSSFTFIGFSLGAVNYTFLPMKQLLNIFKQVVCSSSISAAFNFAISSALSSTRLEFDDSVFEGLSFEEYANFHVQQRHMIFTSMAAAHAAATALKALSEHPNIVNLFQCQLSTHDGDFVDSGRGTSPSVSIPYSTYSHLMDIEQPPNRVVDGSSLTIATQCFS